MKLFFKKMFLKYIKKPPLLLKSLAYQIITQKIKVTVLLKEMLKVLQEKRGNWAQQTKPQATTLISLWLVHVS